MKENYNLKSEIDVFNTSSSKIKKSFKTRRNRNKKTFTVYIQQSIEIVSRSDN